MKRLARRACTSTQSVGAAQVAAPEESVMSTNISQSMLPEFDTEIANTRKTLERVGQAAKKILPAEPSRR